MNTQASFLVIGAGPVGLAVAKALGEAGIPYVQAEATDHVGGNWAHGVYSTAHIISSRKTTEYSDWPMPAHWPDFPSAAQMNQYYNDYTAEFGLAEHIRFNAEVASVLPRDDERFDVTFADGTEQTFKGVLVCNGHHWSKILPAWTADYTGTVLHSKDYKEPSQLAGKRVLVLGGGNSGCDVVSEAARVGACADWSLRRGYWSMPKTFLGRPTVEMMRGWVPMAVQRKAIATMIRMVVGKYSDYGLPEPDHKIFETHPTVSTEVFHYLKHGKITPRPDVARVDGDVVHFTDGTQATYDLIVCATGFRLAFPFLPEGMVQVKGKVAQVLAGSLLRDRKHLYIVGTTQPRYGLGPLVRPMAVVLADWLKIQDEIDVPLGEVMWSMGQRPPETHLVDPHAALAMLKRAKRLGPLLRLKGRAMSKRRGVAGEAVAAK